MHKADIILVDAKYLLWRSAAGSPDEPVGLWFHLFLQAKADHLKPGGKMILCWDDDKNITQRRKWWPDYKKLRGTTRAPEFIRIARAAKANIKQALSFTSIPQALAPEWEADDVIGTLLEENKGKTSFIFSADRDFYQVLEPGVYLMNVKKKDYTFIDKEAAEELMGVPVDRIVLSKALSGDAGDGVPGVRGIGPKKAAKLLHKHSFNLKACADELEVPYPTIKLYKALVRINRNVNIEWTSGKDDPKGLLQFLLSIRAKSLIMGKKYRRLYD